MFEHVTQTAVLDWESYWDTKSGYSLKKQSYTEYVRDKRFRAHGVAVSLSWEDFKPRWVTHKDIGWFLESVDWTKTRMVAHNGLFDFLVAAEIYGIVPAQYFCTMAAASAWHKGETRVGLDHLAQFHRLRGKEDGLTETNGVRVLPADMEQRLISYALQDVRLGAIFYGKYYPKLPASELELMDVIFRMFCDPLLEVDLGLVREGFKDALRKRIEKLDKAAEIEIDGQDELIVDSATLRSRPKFAQLLIDLGVDPPMKKNKKGQDTFAFAKTDEAFLELLDHPDQRVRDAVEAQMEAKSTIALTRAMRLFRMGKTGKLAVAYNYGKTRTDRLSGGNKMNLQNFQRGSKLRRAICAPDGYVLGVADSSNIESRGTAWFSQQEDKLERFRAGVDPYDAMASAIYSRPIVRKRKEVHPETGELYEPDFIEGFVGKTAELGLSYGMGPPKFQSTCKRGMGGVSVDLDLDFCQYVVQTWRRTHYRVVEAWGMLDQWCQMLAAGTGDPIEYMGLTLKPREKRIWFPNGTSIHYPDIQFSEDGRVVYRDLFAWKDLYGGKLLENIIQKLSRDVIVDQLLRINRRYRVVMMTHDENIWVMPLYEAEEGFAWARDQMTIAPSWAEGWPLAASGGWAVNYSK